MRASEMISGLNYHSGRRTIMQLMGLTIKGATKDEHVRGVECLFLKNSIFSCARKENSALGT